MGCLPQAAWPELLSEKSGRCGIAAIERGALPMIDRERVYRRTNQPLQQYLGFTAGRWLWSSSSIKADSLIAKFKEAGGTVRRD